MIKDSTTQTICIKTKIYTMCFWKQWFTKYYYLFLFIYDENKERSGKPQTNLEFLINL